MNNSKFRNSGINNPCPICDRTKDKDCRISENGSMVLCHSSINGDLTKDGWKYIGANSDDRCGIYVIPSEKSPRPVGINFKHIYSDRQGNQYRFNREYKPDGKKVTTWAKPLGIKESELLPYRWAEVKEAIANQKPIYLIEGELGADELVNRFGLVATNLRTKPTLETLELFKSVNLIICPDRDETGIKKALAHYEAFKPVAASIKMMLAEPSKWDYIPAKDGRDVYDWIVDGCTKEDIESAIAPFDLAQFADQGNDDNSTLDAEYLATLTSYPKPQRGLLPEIFERAITGLAQKMGLSPELYYADLLAAAGSLIPIGTTLLIDSGTDYHCPPIFWVGTVAETGAMKSPKSRAILSPLIELQYNAEEIYKAELEIWQAQEKAGESTGRKPIGRDYYLSDFTLEYISQTISKQPLQGFTLYMDELATFFQGFNQYRSGKGNDRPKFLSAYDGGAWKSNRKSDDTRVFAKRTGISIIGGIQPSILQNIMTDDLSSEDGLWARFSWIRLPLTKTPAPSGGKYLVGDLLKGLYCDLSNLPAATYTLSKQAQQLWADWHDEMESIKLVEASPILRAIYPKMKERAGRIALIAHCISHRDGLLVGVSVETLEKAISFTRWLIAQSKELYAEFGIGDNPEMSRILKFVNRFQNCGEIKAVQVRAWWSTKKPKLQEIRDFMSKVVNLGYAIAKGDPTQSNYIVIVTRGSQSSHQQIEPLLDIALTVDCVAVNNPVKTVNDFSFDTEPVDCGDCQVDCVPVNSQIEIEKDLQTSLTELTAYSKNGIKNHDDFTDF
ncbi:hypothetical protein Syn7502_02288 [Synechococcus sp. PCC 7502]|uniref:DUF3987 domain-containing protein n=1 Tax=Synechococcus sp. PCC 7502 TaxID=1173263 RepID=UPI00029FEF39|nr:DUF3987 domain-containing protein [Synechococcus sp. PCC 7502]AFY74293.1 hypothetical protein Syn7502_02288 [Synechococcus sp. PCC 7502]